MRRRLVALGLGLLFSGPAGAETGAPDLSSPAAPDLLPPDAVQLPPRLVLRVANPRPGWSYHVVLAQDPDFHSVVAEVTTSNGVALFDSTPLGDLSAKVTAVDRTGAESPSKIYTILRLTAPDLPARSR